MDAFGGGHFARIRIGVGRSETRKNVADHVLSRFRADESKMLEQIVARARDAVVMVLCKGTKEGMNRFNTKNIII
jgi:PTH1 family peptidyl-tRNA hydrolase